MRIDCHVHTSRYSACSRLSPRRACSLARKRRLDGLVLTEHQVQWPEKELDVLRKEFPDLALFSGLEVSLEEGFDVVVIAEVQGLSFPAFPYRAAMAELKSVLDGCRGHYFTFLAHPFRWTSKRSRVMDHVLTLVDGVEMNSANILYGRTVSHSGTYVPDNYALYREVQQEFGLVPLYNSDSHSERTLGSLANDIPGPAPAEGSELALLLKNARPQQYQDPALLLGFL